VQQAAAAAGMEVLSTTAAATKGGVHLLLTADMVLPGQQADLAMTAEQTQQIVRDGLRQAGVVVGDADADVAAEVQGPVFLSYLAPGVRTLGPGQAAALLVNPVCLPSRQPSWLGGHIPGAGTTAGGTIALALGTASGQLVVDVSTTAALAAGLAAGGQVVVLVDDSRKASSAGPPEADCYDPIVERSGPQDVRIVCDVAEGAEPAVLQLHLLPLAGAAGEQPVAGSGVHPLASLPLLVLPSAAAQEVQGLYGRMVEQEEQELAAAAQQAAGEAAEAPATAAGAAAGPAAHPSLTSAASLAAYWQCFAPFARAWVPLLSPAAVALPPAAPAAGPSSEAEATRQADAVALAGRSVSQLLLFLEQQRMPACLDVAMAGLQKQPALEEVVAACLVAGAAAGEHSGAAGSAAAAAELGPAASPSAPAAAAGMPGGVQGMTSAAVQEGAQQGQHPGTAAAAAAAAAAEAGYSIWKASQLEWGDMLLGAVTMAHLAMVLPGHMKAAGCMVAAGGRVCLTGLAAVLLNVCPYLLQLAVPGRWYARHRQRLMVTCTIAAEVLLAGCLAAAALLYGGVVSGQAGRVVVPLLGRLLLVPLLQHALLRPSLPLALCQSCTAWLWGWWRGWPAGGCAGLVLAMLVASVGPAVSIDGRMRRGYGALLARRAATGRA
jgi:hypothetical protein